jgi:hypothetical protein
MNPERLGLCGVVCRSPAGRTSLVAWRDIAAELETRGHLNERGKRYAAAVPAAVAAARSSATRSPPADTPPPDPALVLAALATPPVGPPPLGPALVLRNAAATRSAAGSTERGRVPRRLAKKRHKDRR